MLPLFVELRRVTGCTALRLRESFARVWSVLNDLDQAPLGRIRNEADLPSHGTLHGAFAEAGLDMENDPPTGFRDRPGWFGLHVAPALVGGGEPCELALFWEPFSRVVFARLQPTFNPGAGDALSEFIGSSLRSLPSELRQCLGTVLLTSPVASAEDGDFWYAVRRAPARRAGRAVDVRITLLKRALDETVSIVNARVSSRYALVDLRPFAGDLTLSGARECLRQWQNAYNLHHPQKVSGAAHQFPLLGCPVKGTWEEKDVCGQRSFFEGPMLKASPQKRLESAMAGGGARTNAAALRELLHR